MKMMKSLLLGSAAGLVAVTAGQAAELPVKAKPLEYVKICSLYGAGFYYMPGTDMCIKIGGWVRSEVTWGVNGNSSSGLFNNDVNNRTTNDLWTRERGYITADAREMTAYGTARGYIAVGIASQNTGAEAPSAQFSAFRAFVQWAGFTAGSTVSFYDFYGAGALMYRTYVIPTEDTSDTGWWLWAYTANFGNGFTATISAEERRMSQIIGQSGTVATTISNGGVLPSGTYAVGLGYGGWQSPDIVANLRVDQAWGSAQVMGALHQVNATYYGSPTIAIINGGPSTTDSWGWVVGAGLKVNMPFVSAGDFFLGEVNYTEGATRYLNFGANAENELNQWGANEAWGVSSDCVFGGLVAAGTATGCNLTTAWSVNAGYEHYWTPQWHESAFGGYFRETYNPQANAILCSLEGGGNGAGIGTAAVATAGCNNNWAYWGVGSRLQWDVTKNTYIGLEVIREQLVGASTFNGLLPASLVVAGSGATTVASNESNWTVTVRLHKDFLP